VEWSEGVEKIELGEFSVSTKFGFPSRLAFLAASMLLAE
jgi:hypothetical protein